MSLHDSVIAVVQSSVRQLAIQGDRGAKRGTRIRVVMRVMHQFHASVDVDKCSDAWVTQAKPIVRDNAALGTTYINGEE
jgi:hypothetical protein